MPGFNGTGPTGAGPMTGGGRGMCITDDRKVIERFIRVPIGFGRGLCRGLGRGVGLRLGRRHSR
ncbi:MAG: DUF5320 domain-containing protein [Thermoleophilia bacterium]